MLFVLFLGALLSEARGKTENWIEVRSQHFIIATNSSEKQGRHVADQFERMRSVFHRAFPKLHGDSGSPIVVLAIKDERDFRALEPEAYLAKGQIKLGGLFLRAPDKNYVLMRLDAEGEHPYAVVYHEYTHLLLAKSADWIPLWLNEGLAEFYQNTEIHEKEALLGEPSAENLILLRQNRLLPLATLFTVDEKSPYYHEENKGSIFYAESWALTHMIQTKDFKGNSHQLLDYAELLSKNIDAVTAASRAFGDLQKLERTLEAYVRQGSFTYFRMAASTEVDESAFTVQALTPVQADALQADFLAYSGRTADARSLLGRVLLQDPKNVSGLETMGFLEFRQGHLDEALKLYAQAVQLDSQSFLAHYYFAAMSMRGASAASDEAQAENSLRTAIKLNPEFAPAYDQLGVFLAMHHRDLEEAHKMCLTAVSLDPANVDYRINVANVLLTMEQAANAVAVLRNAAKLATKPEEAQAVEMMLMRAQEYAAAQAQAREYDRQVKESSAPHVSTEETVEVSSPTHIDSFVPKGPHRFLTGTLKNIYCHLPEIDLTVDSGGKSLPLHSENYFKIQFTSLGFQPRGELNPCKDLEGRPAKVEYVESANSAALARVLGIELHK